jgi:hypothetical protein
MYRTLIVSTRDPDSGYGDFSTMIDDERYQNVLFLFNDDIDHFYSSGSRKDGRKIINYTEKNYKLKGWGTAAIRPYREIRSEGVPTGWGYGESNYFKSISTEVKRHIDVAIDRIAHSLINNNYKYAIIAGTRDGRIGHGVYKGITEEVSMYIMLSVAKLFDEIGFSSSYEDIDNIILPLLKTDKI